MADTKLTALAETTSPATTDDVYIVTTPGGTPASKRCTIANLKTTLGFPTFVGARYATNAAQAITSAGGNQIVDFEDQDYDSGSLVTTGASWHFTTPATGYYRISAFLTFASTANTTPNGSALYVYKGGALLTCLARMNEPTATLLLSIGGSTTVALTAADSIDIRVQQNMAASVALYNDGAYNWVSIERVG